MPKIAKWDDLPAAVRRHLIERLHDRRISIAELNELRLWLESSPVTPDGDWFKDFGSFKICGRGPYPKTFLLKGQSAKWPAPLIATSPPGLASMIERRMEVLP